MDEIKMEREIKEMLHQCADELHAPDSMQARVKFALNNAPVRKRHLWSKRFVAVAAVAAIAVTGAFAATAASRYSAMYPTPSFLRATSRSLYSTADSIHQARVWR